MRLLSRIFVGAALSAALVMAPRVIAQGRGDRPDMSDPATRIAMKVTMLTARLSLTEAQKTQATTIFTQAATESATPRATSETLRTQLRDAVKTNNIGTINQLTITLGTLSGQLTAIELRAEAAFYAILTAEQKTKYDAGQGHGGFGRLRGPGGDR